MLTISSVLALTLCCCRPLGLPPGMFGWLGRSLLLPSAHEHFAGGSQEHARSVDLG